MKVFEEIEFWGAIVKIAAIIVMIVFGLAIIIFGVGNGGVPIGISNLYAEGGFLPMGIGGLMLSLVVVTFAFLLPGKIFGYVMSISILTIVLNWILIFVT